MIFSAFADSIFRDCYSCYQVSSQGFTQRRCPMTENDTLTNHPQLNQWIVTVATHMPHLSKPQATVLALWSFGMVLAKCCALTAVVLILAPLLNNLL
jgi:hypothetical protein